MSTRLGSAAFLTGGHLAKGHLLRLDSRRFMTQGHLLGRWVLVGQGSTAKPDYLTHMYIIGSRIIYYLDGGILLSEHHPLP